MNPVLLCEINLLFFRYIEITYDNKDVSINLITQYPWYNLQDSLFKGKSYKIGGYKL